MQDYHSRLSDPSSRKFETFSYLPAMTKDEIRKQVEYLVKKGELPKEMFTAKGFGETKPIADNKTPEGREQNRRVVINILDRAAPPAPPPTPAPTPPPTPAPPR